jgi:hypothetical protein
MPSVPSLSQEAHFKPPEREREASEGRRTRGGSKDVREGEGPGTLASELITIISGRPIPMQALLRGSRAREEKSLFGVGWTAWERKRRIALEACTQNVVLRPG